MSRCSPCRPAPRGRRAGRGAGARGGTRRGPCCRSGFPQGHWREVGLFTLLRSKVSSVCCLRRDRWEHQCQLVTAPAGEVISILLLHRQEWPKPRAGSYCRHHVMAPVSGGGLRGRETTRGLTLQLRSVRGRHGPAHPWWDLPRQRPSSPDSSGAR